MTNPLDELVEELDLVAARLGRLRLLELGERPLIAHQRLGLARAGDGAQCLSSAY